MPGRHSQDAFRHSILVALGAQPTIAVVMCLKKKKMDLKHKNMLQVRVMCVKHEALHSLCGQLGYFKIEVCLTDD